MTHTLRDVLTRDEIDKLRAMIDESPFETGDRTAGKRAREVKNNLQLAPDAEYRREIQEMVAKILLTNTEFRDAALTRKLRPPMINRYAPGMTYGAHVDNPLMGKDPIVRTDLSFTLFLCDPDSYDGGELVIDSPFGEQVVKLPAGWLFLYPSSTLHHVRPVTRGERVAVVGWLESFVRDAGQREILYDMNRIKRFLAEHHPDAAETNLASKTHSNLMRLWAET
jgi:PKHD-type hydroxylase